MHAPMYLRSCTTNEKDAVAGVAVQYCYAEPTGGCKVNQPAGEWAEIIQTACLVQRRVRMAARDGYRAWQDRME